MIGEERGILCYRDISKKQFEVLFSNKQSPETVYLDILLKEYKKSTKNRLTKIFEIKELFLEISGLKNSATKDKLAKEYREKLNDLVEYKKTGKKI